MKRKKEQHEFDKLLTALFQQTACPTPQQLLEYEYDLLNPINRQAIEPHLAICPHCQSALAAVSVDRITELVERLQATGKQIIEAVWSPPTPALVTRGYQQSATYHAHNYQIHLQIVPPGAEENSRRIEGTVVHKEKPTEVDYRGIVYLLGEEDTLEEAINEWGVFKLEQVPLGNYTVLLEFDDRCLLVEDFVVS